MGACPPSPGQPATRSPGGSCSTLEHTGRSWTRYRSATVVRSPISPASCQAGSRSRCAGSDTAAQRTPSGSRSTPPPATATKMPSCAPASRPAPRKKPSTPPAPSTWPGSATNQLTDPRRTYGTTHLGTKGRIAQVPGCLEIRGSDERTPCQSPSSDVLSGNSGWARSGVASRSAPKIGHRRSQNQAKRTHASRLAHTSAC